MRRCEMGEETSTTTCRNETKNWVHTRHLSQRCPVVNLWQRHSPVAGSQTEKGKVPKGLQLQAAGTEKCSYLCRAQWQPGLAFSLGVASAWQAVSILHTDTLNVPLHPPDYTWKWTISSVGASLWGAEALAEGLSSVFAKGCVLICTAVLVCGWAPSAGITCPQTHGAPGQGWDVLSPSLSQRNGWLEVLLARQQLLSSQYPFSIKLHI